MKCTTLFLVLSMVVLMAQPGECFIGWIIKGIGHAIKDIHNMIHGNGKVAEEQADQLDQDQLNRQQLDQNKLDQDQLDQDQLNQQQLDQDKLDQEDLDQDQLNQEDLDQQQLDKRSY
ncbi:moronecidin-like [Poeciliopsis prolifica]|uniref:moronecidin-like n=1 Tax=Poeciliopsis prolifica TaxID=188132 RepID=UPI0024134882|nr:moronecidin-like [Poeciliopsis prolifica]